jgi:predicted nucleic acid-binding protein
VKFVDTSWWVAWTVPRDRRLEEAVRLGSTVGSSEQVVTTNLVVGETWTFLGHRDSHRVALGFLDRVQRLGITVIWWSTESPRIRRRRHGGGFANTTNALSPSWTPPASG